jgi:hypothetical protein
MFYPVPAILYDRGYPMYTYYAYLAKEAEPETKPAPTAHARVQL